MEDRDLFIVPSIFIIKKLIKIEIGIKPATINASNSNETNITVYKTFLMKSTAFYISANRLFNGNRLQAFNNERVLQIVLVVHPVLAGLFPYFIPCHKGARIANGGRNNHENTH